MAQHTLNYTWTPTIEGHYNVTAYVNPVPEEFTVINNVRSATVSVYTPVVGPTTLHLHPSESTVTVGNSLTINVTVSNVSDLFAWGIVLSFDNTVLDCREDMVWLPEDHVFSYLPPEDFWELPPRVWYDAMQDSWVVIYGAVIWGTDLPLFSGSGTLCQINFTGVAVGISSLTIPPTDPRTDLITPDTESPSGHKSIEFDVSDGNVLVVPPLLSDLDQDGFVTIADISVAAIAFGSFPGHPRWNPIADLNKDGWVDISDIAKIAFDFGKTV